MKTRVAMLTVYVRFPWTDEGATDAECAQVDQVTKRVAEALEQAHDLDGVKDVDLDGAPEWTTDEGDDDEGLECSRCGAKWADEPSCGKSIHGSLPEREA